jgi:hypothetical protein
MDKACGSKRRRCKIARGNPGNWFGQSRLVAFLRAFFRLTTRLQSSRQKFLIGPGTPVELPT